MHNAVPSVDFALANPGSFRTEWLPGIIQYQHFYNMFPFDNFLETFQITGAELIKMVSVLQTGAKGIYHIYGLQQVIQYSSSTKKYNLMSVKWSDGSQIIADKVYKGVTSDFMINGGDDFRDVIDSGAYKPRNVINVGDLRALLKLELVKWGNIK